MFRPLIQRTLPSVAAGILMLGLAPMPASAQLEIKNEDVSVRFGIEAQFWADWSQDATAPTAAPRVINRTSTCGARVS